MKEIWKDDVEKIVTNNLKEFQETKLDYLPI